MYFVYFSKSSVYPTYRKDLDFLMETKKCTRLCSARFFVQLFDLLQRPERRGEGASKRVMGVSCRKRAGDRVTDIQNDRARED